MPQLPVEVKAITVEASPTVMYADKVGEVKGSQEVDIRSHGLRHPAREALRRRRAGRRRASCCTPSTRASSARRWPTPRRRWRRPKRTSPAPARTWSGTGRCWPTRRSPGRSTTTPSPRPRQAEAQVTASRAALDETRLGVEYAQIRAPLQRPHRRGPGLPRRPRHGRPDAARHHFQRRPGLGLFPDQRNGNARLRKRHGTDATSPADDPVRDREADPERRLRLSADRPHQLRRPRARPDDRHATRSAPSSRTRTTALIPGMFARVRATTGKLGQCAGRAGSRRAGAARQVLPHRGRRRATRRSCGR